MGHNGRREKYFPAPVFYPWKSPFFQSYNFGGPFKFDLLFSFFCLPPKSPEGGLIGRDISIIKPTLYKSPFGGFRGH
jgi:hypothetical protein